MVNDPSNEVVLVKIIENGSDLGLLVNGEYIISHDPGCDSGDALEAVKQAAIGLAKLLNTEVKDLDYAADDGWEWSEVISDLKKCNRINPTPANPYWGRRNFRHWQEADFHFKELADYSASEWAKYMRFAPCENISMRGHLSIMDKRSSIFYSTMSVYVPEEKLAELEADQDRCFDLLMQYYYNGNVRFI